MKTFEELMAGNQALNENDVTARELNEGTVSIDLDVVGTTAFINKFMKQAVADKIIAKKVGKVNGNDVIKLTGEQNKLYQWILKNYDPDMDQDDFEEFLD